MKLSTVLLAVTVLASVAPAAHAKGKKFALDDIKALNADGSYLEAFQHIGDVPPAQRKGEWIDVAAEAAVGALGTLDTDDGSTIEAITQIDKLYPQLLKNAKYAKTRAELGFKGIQGCFDQTNDYWGAYGLDNCVKLANAFLNKTPDDRALALKVAKVARKSMNAYDAVPFFKRTLSAKDTAACKDEDLKLAVVAGLGLPTDYDKAAQSRALATTCWDQIKGAVVKEFNEDSDGGYVRQNVCSMPAAQKVITPGQCPKS